MFINKYLPSWFNFNSTTTNEKTTKNETQTNGSSKLLKKIYEYNLSRAYISTSDNNFIKVKISGNPESKIFNNEKDLDSYLYSLRKTIDIFKIYDQRKNNSTPTYKYNDIAWECISNFTKKDSLLYDIASETLGVFKINDLDKNKKYYLKKNTKWLFFWRFEKIDMSSALQTVHNKKQSQESWRKIYAFGLIALSLSPAIYGAASSISKGLSAVSNKIKGISLQECRANPFGVNINANVLNFVAANILISSFTQKNSFARLASSIFSSIKLVNADFFCPTLTNYPLSETPFAVAHRNNYTYVATRSSFIIFDSRNQSNLLKTGECSIPNPALYTLQDIAPTDEMAYVAAGQAVFAIDTANKSNPFIADRFNTSDTRAVAVSGGNVYFGSDWDNFQVVNRSIPMTPVGSISGFSFGSKRIIISNMLAYSIGNYLIVINVSNPFSPTLEGYRSIPGILFDGDKLDDLIVTVGSYYNAYNVSNSSFPEQIGNSSSLSPFGRAIKIYKKAAFIGAAGSIASWNIDSPGSAYNQENFSISGSVALDIFNDTIYSLETNPRNLNTIELNCFSSTTSSESSTSSSLTSSSSKSSVSSSSSKSSASSSSSERSSTFSSSKSSSSSFSGIPTTSTESTLPSTDFFSSKKTTAINSATTSTINPSIMSIGTQNIHTSNSSSNSTKKRWVLPAIIVTAIIIIPASILAFFKLKKKKSQNSSTIEMQNNDPERALQVLPQTDSLPPSQDLPQAQEEETDEEPTYMVPSLFPIQSSQGEQEGQERTYSKLLDVALIQEEQDEKNQYAHRPIREDFLV